MGNYCDNYDNAVLGFATDATYSIYALPLLDDSKMDEKRLNLFPYVAYQKDY